ncbi:bifunctional diaminohydroxyphosphoribosylaminopyrimidine deaminase/5-amino-6-(5-phosphoribosylamino)uracil reductase RibD [Cryptosporangium minutisporangium]
MRHALVLSAAGLGSTSPNPPVGCVILTPGGQTAGTGWHARKGEPHAETQALAAAGDRARGGTAVVTLEPCNHVGRTPACRQALLDAGVARVVIGVLDPTSRGEGGAAVLRAHGVEVEVGVLADEVTVVLGPWLTAQTTGRPTVTAAYQAAADGISAVTDGALIRELSAGVDVVIHPDGRLQEANRHGRDVLTLPTNAGMNDPACLLTTLYTGGARTVLLLGEPQHLPAFLAAGLIDRAVVMCPLDPPVLRESLLTGFQVTGVAKAGGKLRIDLLRPASIT